jgi:hypothetical protein
VIRREGFAQRFGGLRYTVRRSLAAGAGERREADEVWRHELGTRLWSDPTRGWYFDWNGPNFAAPIRYLAHTDGRVGAENTSGDGVFQETEASMTHRIESHALMDEVSSWNPWPIDAHGPAVAQQLEGLSEVTEASGPMLRWRKSDAVAVMEFAYVDLQDPRERQAYIWFRTGEGHRQIRAALARATGGASVG